jgi:hypothetical protein
MPKFHYIILEDNPANAEARQKGLAQKIECPLSDIDIVEYRGEEQLDIQNSAFEAADICKTAEADVCVFIFDMAMTESPDSKQLTHGFKVLKEMIAALEPTVLDFLSSKKYRVLFMTVHNPAKVMEEVNRILGLQPEQIAIYRVQDANLAATKRISSAGQIPVVVRGDNNWIEEIVYGWTLRAA